MNGKVVLDIGANIGDSAIFFALQGASKVIAFEPIPSNFKLLEYNVILNSFDNIIISLKKGISVSNKILKLPSELQGTIINAEEVFQAYTDKEEVEFIALSDVINNYMPHILKIDCEGCEYELFGKTSPNVLSTLETIVGDYHYERFGELKQILKNAGFVCKNKKQVIQTGSLLSESGFKYIGKS